MNTIVMDADVMFYFKSYITVEYYILVCESKQNRIFEKEHVNMITEL